MNIHFPIIYTFFFTKKVIPLQNERRLLTDNSRWKCQKTINNDMFPTAPNPSVTFPTAPITLVSSSSVITDG